MKKTKRNWTRRHNGIVLYERLFAILRVDGRPTDAELLKELYGVDTLRTRGCLHAVFSGLVKRGWIRRESTRVLVDMKRPISPLMTAYGRTWYEKKSELSRVTLSHVNQSSTVV